MRTMSNLKVTEITLAKPIIVVGKLFTGDYAKSPEYISVTMEILRSAGISFDERKVIGVYYDNPNNKKPEELKSFQGVFIDHSNIEIPGELEICQLKGNFLYVKATGDIMKAIYEGYDALFNYIAENNVKLKSPAGYQVSTIDNGNIVTEIYMETI